MVKLIRKIFPEDRVLVEIITKEEIEDKEKEMLFHYLKYKTKGDDTPRSVISVNLNIIKKDIVLNEGECDFLDKVIAIKLIL